MRSEDIVQKTMPGVGGERPLNFLSREAAADRIVHLGALEGRVPCQE